MGIEYDPFSSEVQKDPYPYYAELRESAPVYYVKAADAWAVSRFADVLQIVKAPEIFSSHALQDFLGGGILKNRTDDEARRFGSLMQSRALISADPPDHTRLRHLVNRGFTPQRVQELEPRIREITRQCLDAVASRGELDLMADFAVPIPVTVIAELLGVPADRFADFKRWSDAVVQGVSLGRARAPTPELLAEMAEFVVFLSELVESRKTNPKDDLISVLVQKEEGGALTFEELMLFAIVLLVAGNETTTNLLGNAVNLLLDRPSDLAQVIQDPSWSPASSRRRSASCRPFRCCPAWLFATLRSPGNASKWGRPCSSSLPPPTATHASFPAATSSTCTEPQRTTWPLVSASTTALAPLLLGSKAESRSKSSSRVSPTSAVGRGG